MSKGFYWTLHTSLHHEEIHDCKKNKKRNENEVRKQCVKKITMKPTILLQS